MLPLHCSVENSICLWDGWRLSDILSLAGMAFSVTDSSCNSFKSLQEPNSPVSWVTVCNAWAWVWEHTLPTPPRTQNSREDQVIILTSKVFQHYLKRVSKYWPECLWCPSPMSVQAKSKSMQMASNCHPSAPSSLTPSWRNSLPSLLRVKSRRENYG